GSWSFSMRRTLRSGPAPWQRFSGLERAAAKSRGRLDLVPQVVTGVAAGILLQVLLVVLLGRRERSRRDDLRDDRGLPLAARVHALLDALGDLALPLRRDEDRRAVLRADVVALPVLGRRVMHPEVPFLQQVLVRQRRGIEDD